MLRNRSSLCKVLVFAALVTSLALTVGSGVAWAQTSPTRVGAPTTSNQPVFEFTYFSNARQALDGRVRIVNGGSAATTNAVSPDGDLCAFIYVFFKENISECCGCLVTADGGLELSINRDLTGNPVSGPLLTRGVIKLVSATPNGNVCDPSKLLPASSFACFICSLGGSCADCPAAGLSAWATHIQAVLPNQSFPASEEEFSSDTLSDAEAGALAKGCGAIGTAAGTKGICSCGTAQ
jgi:hypothetical protein